MTGGSRHRADAPHRPLRLRIVSKMIKISLWAVTALSVGVALADMLAARPWYCAATAAAVATGGAVLLGRPARCGHYAQLFREVQGIGCVCRRRVGHRGLHKDHALRWDSTGVFLTSGSQPPTSRVLRALGRSVGFIATQVGSGPRCGHRSQLMPGHGGMPVTCKLRRGHWGRRHRDSLAVWTGDGGGARRSGGPQ